MAIITRGRYAGKKVRTKKDSIGPDIAVDKPVGLRFTDLAIRSLIRNSIQVVIIQPIDSGSKSHPFPHALVAGIERYPQQVTRRMSKAKQQKRSKVKPFIKTVNYNHLMPTRYTLELEGLKGVVTNDTFKEVSQREDAKKTVKKALDERYQSGKNRWFFTPLSEFSIIFLLEWVY